MRLRFVVASIFLGTLLGVSLALSYFPPPPGITHPSPAFFPRPVPPRLSDTDSHENDDEFLDFALVSLKKPKRITQDNLEGLSLPFIIENDGEQEYGVEIKLICSDFKAETTLFPVKPGKSRQAVFHPFQSAAQGREEEMHNFVIGKKNEACSLNISQVQHPNFDDISEPADSDLSNNSFRFTLALKNRNPMVSEIRRDTDNISEQSKKLFAPLSDEELDAYRKLSEDQCLNVLIASEDRGFYYNGELIDADWIRTDLGPKTKIQEAHIAGDRLGYVKLNTVIVDGEDVGVLNDIGSFGGVGNEIRLKLNEKHYAYPRLVAYDKTQYMPTYHLIYDGEDLGEAGTIFYKLNGDFIIYQKYGKVGGDKVHSWLFANGKKIADGALGDFDGKNLAYVDTNGSGQVISHGKKMLYGSDITLKDGHFAFTQSNNSQGANPKIYYDGKILGPGREPVVEKNHIAYLSEDIVRKIVYDGQVLGEIGGRWKIDLAGDHIAYMRRLRGSEKLFEYSEDFARVNIDGKDYPGDFFSGNVYVEIEEKKDRSTCRGK